MKRKAYGAVLVLVGSAIGALVVAMIFWRSERGKAWENVDTVQVDILSADEVASLKQRRAPDRSSPSSPAAGTADQSGAKYIDIANDSSVQLTIQRYKIYDVRFPPGAYVLFRADSGKVLLLIDDTTTFCVENTMVAIPQRKLRVSTCDNKDALMTAAAQMKPASDEKVKASK